MVREEAELLSQVRKFKPQNCMTCLDSHTEVFFAQEGFASATSDYATRAFLLYHLLREKVALLSWISKRESSMVYLDALCWVWVVLFLIKPWSYMFSLPWFILIYFMLLVIDLQLSYFEIPSLFATYSVSSSLIILFLGLKSLGKSLLTPFVQIMKINVNKKIQHSWLTSF